MMVCWKKAWKPVRKGEAVVPYHGISWGVEPYLGTIHNKEAIIGIALEDNRDSEDILNREVRVLLLQDERIEYWSFAWKILVARILGGAYG